MVILFVTIILEFSTIMLLLLVLIQLPDTHQINLKLWLQRLSYPQCLHHHSCNVLKHIILFLKVCSAPVDTWKYTCVKPDAISTKIVPPLNLSLSCSRPPDKNNLPHCLVLNWSAAISSPGFNFSLVMLSRISSLGTGQYALVGFLVCWPY